MNRHERRKAEKLDEDATNTPKAIRKNFTRDDVNKIVQNRDQLYQQYLHHVQNEMADFLGNVLALELNMSDILHTVAMFRGEELRQHITQDDVDYLEQLYVPIDSFAKRYNGQNQVYVRVDMFKEAMTNLIEHKDNGESLRQIVDTIGARASILAEYRDTVKKPGPKSRTQWRKQLKDMVTEIENNNPGIPAYKIRYKILEGVGVRDAHMGYTGRPEIENSNEIIESLHTEGAQTNPAAYFMKLKNMS